MSQKSQKGEKSQKSDGQTIGVAIPCYKGHIYSLKMLLASIQNQTRLPDRVVVSCSSSTIEDVENVINTSDYRFPLEFVIASRHQSAAQNRNTACRRLNTDIISFFDADDLMHPQRLEFIGETFREHPTSVMIIHAHDTGRPRSEAFQMLDDVTVERGVLYELCKTTAHRNGKSITMGHCSVTRSILGEFSYQESVDYYGWEDTYFCAQITKQYPDQVLYIPQALSRYYPSNTRGHLI